MKYLILLIALVFTSNINCQIQSKNQDYSLERIGYRERIRILEPIFQKAPTQKSAIELAEAFLKLKKYQKSISYFEYAISKGELDNFQMANYFSALYEFGDYDLARKIANDYNTKFNNQELLAKLDSAESLKNKDQVYYELNLPTNTSNNEFGFYNFNSNYKIINSDVLVKNPDIEINNSSKKYFNSYLINAKDTSSEPELQSLIDINKNFNDVVSFYDETEKKIYFTRTNIAKIPNASNVKIYKTLKIFISKIDSNLNFLNQVAFPYNSDSYSCWNPVVSRDGEILYFVSDMPGGFGGADIYRCMKLEEDGTWGNPINLGKNVNTPEDELYPYISPYGTTLYFSSNGLSVFGGLDINKSEKSRYHEFSPSVNMGIPFNSNKDDYAFNFSDKYGTEGYFTSNRAGGKGGDDIYNFSYFNNRVCLDPVKNFTMIVMDKKTKQRIPNVDLKMTVKADGKVYQDKSDANGEVHLRVEGCNDFDVEATHDLYLNNSFYYDGFKKSVTIELDKKELNNIIALEKIYYDLGKYEVTPTASTQLSKLAILLSRNPDIKIELSSHTDSRGDDASNLKLSQKRADHIVKFLTNNGIKSSQLVSKGYGEMQLVNQCGNNQPCTEDLHEKNRRTEFKILEIVK